MPTTTRTTIGSPAPAILKNSERELENTVLLLVRHFDQQLQQLELVQKRVAESIRSAGIAPKSSCTFTPMAPPATLSTMAAGS